MRLLLYVDDIILTSNLNIFFHYFNSTLGKYFELSDLDSLSYFHRLASLSLHIQLFFVKDIM